MADTWDGDDFEPQLKPIAPLNQWADEDVDDDVKECWEDVAEEKKDEEKVEVKVAPPPKSKSKKNFGKDKNLPETDDIFDLGLTKEEIELRKRKMQEESDLEVAMETFGVAEPVDLPPVTGIDGQNPNTKEEFVRFKDALIEKISYYREHDEFSEFATDLVKNLCLHLNATTLKTLKGNVENLFHEKQKLEKAADKNKKPTKGKSKAKLLVESNMTQMYGYDNDFGNEYDDFM